MLNRRGFLSGLLVAPAVVHAGNLMPVNSNMIRWMEWNGLKNFIENGIIREDNCCKSVIFGPGYLPSGRLFLPTVSFPNITPAGVGYVNYGIDSAMFQTRDVEQFCRRL